MEKVFIYLLILLITSCSREQHLKKVEIKSSVTFGGSVGGTAKYDATTKTLNDTIKVVRNQKYVTNIELANTDGLKQIVVSSAQGSVLTPIIPIKQGIRNYSISYNATGNDGKELITVNVIKNNNESETYSINLYCFKNMAPISQIDYNSTEIVLGNSYDQDARFGGRIVKYKLWVNNNLYKDDAISKITTNSQNGFRAGTIYNLKLEVMDNDNAVHTSEKTIQL
jgi:hypothetical protein